MIGTEVIRLVDYYTQRILNPDGTSLVRCRYEYEEESIYKDGVEYKIHARFIGNGYFYIHIQKENRYRFCGQYFNENDSIEAIHEELINYLDD